MSLKDDYNLSFSIIKRAIDEFDPMNLLPHAPSDEYDMESTKILAQISVNSTIEEITKVIMNVFSKSFNENFEENYCKPIAVKLFISICVCGDLFESRLALNTIRQKSFIYQASGDFSFLRF